MLEQQELDRINKTFSDLKKAENEVVAIEAEVGVIKKQAKEIFTKYGLTGFGDIDKLKEMLKEREEQANLKLDEVKTIVEELKGMIINA